MTKRTLLKGEPGPYDPCPCGGERQGKFCCRTPRSWFKRPNLPKIETPTGYAHPECFAAPLRDCSEKLSGEHVIPRACLEAGGGKTVVAEGITWLKGERKPIGVSRLEALVSCTRHNNSAKPYDTAVTTVFKSLRAFEAGSWTSGNSTLALVSGPDLERGLLKMCLCAGAAGWLQGDAGVVKLSHGDLGCLEMLYRNRSMAPFPGLHMLASGVPEKASDRITIGFLFDATDSRSVVGLFFRAVGSFVLAVALRSIAEFGSDPAPYAEAWRRPTQLRLRDGDCEKNLLFCWPSGYGADDQHIVEADRLER